MVRFNTEAFVRAMSRIQFETHGNAEIGQISVVKSGPAEKKVKRTLKILLLATMFANAETNSAVAEITPSANRDGGQYAASPPSVWTNGDLSCAIALINHKRDCRHCEVPCGERLFSDDIPELSACLTSCD
jgi:hypothetical protein